MKKIIIDEIEKILFELGIDKTQGFSVEVPPKKEMGDYSSNVALMLAKQFSSPREAAEKISKKLEETNKFKKVEIAGPGFINVYFADEIIENSINKIFEDEDGFLKSEKYLNKTVNVEYISANPTGPLHVGNARGGPIGETIARLLEHQGAKVVREFYVNDIGGQVNRFAESIYYWYAIKDDPREVFPEGGYPGEYIKETSEKIQSERKEDLSKIKDKAELVEFFKKEGLYYIVKEIREDCELLGIKFDKWINQSDIENSGKTDLVVNRLIESGHTVQKEGALWFKNPEDPEMADRESVLRKSDDSAYTYFVDDIAYHSDKFDRGYDLVVDVWGANHHGHIARLNSVIDVLGYDSKKLDIVLYQYIRLKKNGEIVKMGKRLGNFVTLREVIESGVEADAFKYFILSQNSNTPFDFDLGLATDKSDKNPVYYIKYAYARICSILEKSGNTDDMNHIDLNLLKEDVEIDLVKELLKYQDVVAEAAESFQVQLIPHYLYKVACLFHNFYSKCKVIGVDDETFKNRVSLIKATKVIIANTLAICDIHAPEKM